MDKDSDSLRNASRNVSVGSESADLVAANAETIQEPGGSTSQPTLQPSHVIGVAASAGGLEALEHFLRDTSRPGLAFVVVQHLSPDFRSLMDELLARHTKLAIHRVEEGHAGGAELALFDSTQKRAGNSRGVSAPDGPRRGTFPLPAGGHFLSARWPRTWRRGHCGRTVWNGK